MKKSNRILSSIKGILCDIDGTLHFKGAPIPGAIDALYRLRKQKKKLLFLTNTDSKSPRTVYNSLLAYGFSVEEKEIFTPIIALKSFLHQNKDKKVFLVTSKEVKEEFEEFNIVSGEEIPDFVIISDFSDNWNVSRLNQAFRYLLKGAKLFGTQGNRYCLDEEGEPQIDTGSFVRMLADAAGADFTIFGKPSKAFFVQALRTLGLKNVECVAVGDDVESDIQGAKNAGIKSVLVKTGKGCTYSSAKKNMRPDLVINTFDMLLDYI